MLPDRIKLETQPDVIHQALIDWHCHILPGLDDGAKTLDESLAIARELAAAGFKTVYCTPHCMKGVFETTPAQVREGVAVLQTELDRADISLRLEPGMEYYLDEFFSEELDRLLPLGDTKLVLLETPPLVTPRQVKELVFQVSRHGFIPLIAHPERYDYISNRITGGNKGLFGRLKNRLSGRQTAADSAPDLLHELRAMDCRFQGNLGSFAGLYGPEVKKTSELLFAADEYDCFGSDAHKSGSLGKTLAQGLAKVKEQ